MKRALVVAVALGSIAPPALAAGVEKVTRDFESEAVGGPAPGLRIRTDRRRR